MEIPKKTELPEQKMNFISQLKNCISRLFQQNPIQTSQQANAMLALELAGKGVWSWNVTNDVILWDKQMDSLFGLSSHKTPVNYAEFINIIHPDDRQRVDEELKKTLENNGIFNILFKISHKDKSLHYIGAKGKVCLEPENTKILIGVCWDMTQHQMMEDQLKTAKEIAEESSRVKSRFMAKVSHDLRSPLNGIIGFAELMYHGKVGPISTEHKEYLGDILASARQLLILVDDVLDIAKAESGKLVLNPEKIDIYEITRETIDIFQTMINSKHIKFEVQVDPSLKNLVIDSTRLKQVIYNFVSNALKCTNEGGTVILRWVPESQNRFRLEVEDTGIGIQEEDMKRLFIEFEQIDRNIARKYPSSGLGLAVTKHVVEIQGGEVGATSIYGKGSRFYAILPRTPLPKTQENN